MLNRSEEPLPSGRGGDISSVPGYNENVGACSSSSLSVGSYSGTSLTSSSGSTTRALSPKKNGSISSLTGNPNGILLPQSFYKRLSKGDSTNSAITHGYVHGHIHKHKDHTHIHGHIHNHDHDHHNRSMEGSIATGTDDPCREFDEIDLCKDIFCDELDDCFFLNCDDTKRNYCSSTGCCDQDSYLEEICCNDVHCIEESGEENNEGTGDCCGNPKCSSYSLCQQNHSQTTANHQSICNDPQCVAEFPSAEAYDCCSPIDHVDSSSVSHQNNLCDLQLSKKSMFEHLISDVHKNLNQNPFAQFDNNPTQESSSKRRKLEDKEFEIHFPHHCHQQPETNLEVKNEVTKKDENHHHFHQSCFHTTIPNMESENPHSDLDQEKLMNDFDFYIQFNNFNQFLNNSQPVNNTPQTTRKAGSVTLPNSSDLDFMNTNVNGSDMLSIPSLSSNQFSCQWDSCSKPVTDDTFMKHLIGQHIYQEYGFNSDTANTVDPNSTLYHCEWNDCSYMNADINSLIDHLVTHKQVGPHFSPNNFSDSAGRVATLHSHTTLLTPNSTSKETADEGRFNITEIKIMPKKRNNSSIHPQDPHFTCKWQIGVDDNGNPICCDKTHTSEGHLQDHLMNDHIGSGKSVYSCNWLGCERHNGKVFPQRQKLLRHIHVHTNYKPCKCELCGAAFAVDSMLKQHMRTHSGEKPFSCSLCGKKFATSSSLSIHNRVHTGERPLECKWPGCNKRFSESSNLTKHMKIHFKTFKCDACGEEFEKKSDYTKHIKLHKSDVRGDAESLTRIDVKLET
ncbi:putative zinc finger protein [Scheffersomyces xylosifermentans]|uniref:putative zinc finger protein n=1 Tax=Scheffersomyces xylosifermentans TaxID=1304137 RepID=UPI00315D0EA3